MTERLWAIEDCRQLTRALEQELIAAGERLVRVPPKLMAAQRRAGRMRGKSDPIDALAVARAALREPRLDYPRPGEQRRWLCFGAYVTCPLPLTVLLVGQCDG